MSLEKEEKWSWQFKCLFVIIIVWGVCSSVFFDNKCYIYKKKIFNLVNCLFNLVNYLRCKLLIIPIKEFPLPIVDLIIIILPILLLLFSLWFHLLKKIENKKFMWISLMRHIKRFHLLKKIENKKGKNIKNQIEKNINSKNRKKNYCLKIGIPVLILILFIYFWCNKNLNISYIIFSIMIVLFIAYIMMIILGIRIFIKKFGIVMFLMFMALVIYIQLDSWNFLNVKNMKISDLGNENSYKWFIILRLVILLLEQLYVFVFLKFFSEKKITQVIRKRLLISITVIILLYVLFNGFMFMIIRNYTELSNNVFKKNSRDVLSFGITMKLLVSMIFYYIKDGMWDKKSELAD